MMMQNKKHVYAVGLFLLVVVILGFCMPTWGFKTDDWGNIWQSITSSMSEWGRFFVDCKSIEIFNHPCNISPAQQEQAFFCGLFRPMSFVYYAPQYWLFGSCAYGYFLTTIVMHALASVAFFYVLAHFFTGAWAFFGASFFAFHPSLGRWLGWISAQTYQIELFVLLMIILLLLYVLNRRSYLAYVLALVLFASNLFLREQTFFLPFWLMGAIALYRYYWQRRGLGQSVFYGIALSLPFLGASAFYIFQRLRFFPLTAKTTTLTFEPTWASFINRMIERKYDFVTYIVDMFGFSWMPGNNQLIKGVVLISVVVILLLLFRRYGYFIPAFFMAASIPLFSWPSLLMHAQPRYMYMALPIFIAFVMMLLWPLIYQRAVRFFVAFLVMLVVGVHGFFVFTTMHKRSSMLAMVTDSFISLLKNSKTDHKALCFINPPAEYFQAGSAQAVWLLRASDQYPVYQVDGVDAATYQLEQQYQRHNPVYVLWDEQAQKFVIRD